MASSGIPIRRNAINSKVHRNDSLKHYILDISFVQNGTMLIDIVIIILLNLCYQLFLETYWTNKDDLLLKETRFIVQVSTVRFRLALIVTGSPLLQRGGRWNKANLHCLKNVERICGLFRYVYFTRKATCTYAIVDSIPLLTWGWCQVTYKLLARKLGIHINTAKQCVKYWNRLESRSDRWSDTGLCGNTPMANHKYKRSIASAADSLRTAANLASALSSWNRQTSKVPVKSKQRWNS